MGNNYTKLKNSMRHDNSRNNSNSRYKEFGFMNNNFNLNEPLLNADFDINREMDELKKKIQKMESEIIKHNNQMICVKNDLTALLDNDQILMKNINDLKTQNNNTSSNIYTDNTNDINDNNILINLGDNNLYASSNYNTATDEEFN